jgi:diguanylate cyclase (GGDEF)-like protein
MNHQVLEQETQQRLPSPKGVALAILEACSREDVTLSEVASLVKADPALTGRLLAQANSAAIGSRPVASVEVAVSRMGLQLVQQLALGFSLIDQYGQGNCPGFDYPAFWSHSLIMGLAAQSIGAKLQVAAVNELFCCGLLARVGCLALATAYPQEYDEILFKGLNGPRLIELERKTIQTDHLEMSCALLEKWGIPAILVQAVHLHEEPILPTQQSATRPLQLAQTLNLSLQLANFLLAPQLEHSYLISELSALAKDMGIHSIEFGELVDHVVIQWRIRGEQLKIQAIKMPSFASMTQSSLRPDQEPDAQWLRVLIVEDDRIVRMLLESWLKDECHHTVMTAKNGLEALSVALDFKPHVVLTDWLMPVMDGLELCRTLRSSDWGQNIYVLMLTSVDAENELVNAFDAGVDDYLTKPVNMRALNARLKAAWRYVRLRDAWERDHERLTRTAAELALSNRRLQHTALTDELTELANRRAGLIVLSQAWSAATRYGHQLSILSIDVDHFKVINDTYGHASGDQVLQRISQNLRITARQEDTVCRWGGEEFLVICPNVAIADCIEVGERLRKNIAELVILVDGQSIQLTVSMGVVAWEKNMSSQDQLLTEVDKALYAAKKGGRNQLVISLNGTLRKSDELTGL